MDVLSTYLPTVENINYQTKKQMKLLHFVLMNTSACANHTACMMLTKLISIFYTY